MTRTQKIRDLELANELLIADSLAMANGINYAESSGWLPGMVPSTWDNGVLVARRVVGLDIRPAKRRGQHDSR